MNITSYPSDIFTSPDTDPHYRTLFEEVCFNAISIEHLCRISTEDFCALRLKHAKLQPLTEEEFYHLKAIKLEHDLCKRSNAIAKGRHKPNFNAYHRKLDIVYNPIGKNY